MHRCGEHFPFFEPLRQLEQVNGEFPQHCALRLAFYMFSFIFIKIGPCIKFLYRMTFNLCLLQLKLKAKHKLKNLKNIWAPHSFYILMNNLLLICLFFMVLNWHLLTL